MTKKIIAIAGATGAQGGSLARAILADPGCEFGVRALTRDPESENARTLKAQGAEVVFADIDDEDSLRSAFAGAYGAYCVTFFWNHFSASREISQAAALARAAKSADLQHVIWSTLEDSRIFLPLGSTMPTLQERFNVPHVDGKGEADHFFTGLGLPATFLQASFYWENFIYFGLGPRRDEEGKLRLTIPMASATLPGMSSEDIGRCALGIFARGSDLTGRTVGIVGEHLTGSELASELTAALSEDVMYTPLTPDEFRKLQEPGSDELANHFQYMTEMEEHFRASRSTETSRELNPGLESFTGWLARNASRIPIN